MESFDLGGVLFPLPKEVMNSTSKTSDLVWNVDLCPLLQQHPDYLSMAAAGGKNQAGHVVLHNTNIQNCQGMFKHSLFKEGWIEGWIPRWIDKWIDAWLRG